jgi:hypothetical protein
LPFSALVIFSTLSSSTALDADAGTGMGVAMLVAAAVVTADTETERPVSPSEIGVVAELEAVVVAAVGVVVVSAGSRSGVERCFLDGGPTSSPDPRPPALSLTLVALALATLLSTPLMGAWSVSGSDDAGPLPLTGDREAAKATSGFV